MQQDEGWPNSQLPDRKGDLSVIENSKELEDFLQTFRRTIETFGWTGGKINAETSSVAEATLVVILRHYFTQMCGEIKPITGIVDEILQVASFANLELEVVLNTLLLIYDKDLLIRSKKLISKEWTEVDQAFLSNVNDCIGRNIAQGVYPPRERTDGLCGLSLVITFEYPSSFWEAAKNCLDPICQASQAVYCTPVPHFTILNVGTEIPLKNVQDVCRNVRERLESEIRRNDDLCRLVQSVCKCAKMRSETRLMPDGSIIMLGSGAFPKQVHELRLKLREDMLALDLGPSHKRDAQPVWTYAVLARIGEHPIGMDKIGQLQRSYRDFRRDWPQTRQAELARPALKLMIFRDKKAILRPELCEICY